MNSLQFILLFLILRSCSLDRISTKDFCSFTGDYDECPLRYPYRCGENKCARNAFVCNYYFRVEAHFNSRLFKSYAHLALFPPKVEKIFKRQEMKFHDFQRLILKCSHSAFVWNSTNVCFQAKMCYEKVKLPSASIIHWMFESNQSYQMVRIDCPCDTQLNYKCQKEFCAVSKRACEAFISIGKKQTQQNIKNVTQSCQ